MALPSLIAFGALAPWPASDRLDQLRNTLQHHESLKPIVKVVQELPLLWKALSNRDPSLHSIAGEAAAQQLAQWMTGASTTHIVEDGDNVTRMPVTIIAQIAQYISYLRQSDESLDHESITRNVAVGGGIQGFCIGLLSALAVASGKTEDDVGNFAAISVRLAFCIGAYVDLDQRRNGDNSRVLTLAVRWKAPMTLESVQRLLSGVPNVSLTVNLNGRRLKLYSAIITSCRILNHLSMLYSSVSDPWLLIATSGIHRCSPRH